MITIPGQITEAIEVVLDDGRGDILDLTLIRCDISILYFRNSIIPTMLIDYWQSLIEAGG